MTTEKYRGFLARFRPEFDPASVEAHVVDREQHHYLAVTSTGKLWLASWARDPEWLEKTGCLGFGKLDPAPSDAIVKDVADYSGFKAEEQVNAIELVIRFGPVTRRIKLGKANWSAWETVLLELDRRRKTSQRLKRDDGEGNADDPNRALGSGASAWPDALAPAGTAAPTIGPPPPSKIVCALVAFVIPIGLHRFLMGYSEVGMIQLLTSCLGLGVLWSWADGISILTGSLRMKDGRPLGGSGSGPPGGSSGGINKPLLGCAGLVVLGIIPARACSPREPRIDATVASASAPATPPAPPKIHAPTSPKAPELAYADGEAALARNDPAAAWRSFADAGDYRDAKKRANEILAQAHPEVAITQLDGTTIQGVLLAYDGEDEIVLRTDDGTIRVDRRSVKAMTVAPKRAPPASVGRLPSWRTCVDRLATGPRAASLRQIPATVIDTGVMRSVPYLSHRAATLELNVYGDPEAPAAIEVGIFDAGASAKPAATPFSDAPRSTAPTRDLDAEKREVIVLVQGLLLDPTDRQLVGALKLDQDRQERGGLTFEVTPATADDAYGGWWISVYDMTALDRTRANADELRAITEPVGSRPGAPGLYTWTPADYARARSVRGDKPVFVRSYTRADGTYVQAHTRSRPHR